MQLIQKTMHHVRAKLEKECTGHDWWHAHRVWQIANHIAEKEGGDRTIIQLAALLHDISDWKFNQEKSESAGSLITHDWVIRLGLSSDVAEKVSDIIQNMSFKGARVKRIPLTLEGQIVQDADRLDAIGAIGIARAFAYGGFKGSEVYNPAIKPCLHESCEAYKNNCSSTINHFYEKLLLLKDQMNTPTARQLAEEKHAFMIKYLDQFFKEWGANY